MAVKNTMKVVEKGEKCVNPLYNMSFENIQEIVDYSTEVFDLVSNSFHFGYMQGMKAAKAEMKRRGANV